MERPNNNESLEKLLLELSSLQQEASAGGKQQNTDEYTRKIAKGILLYERTLPGCRAKGSSFMCIDLLNTCFNIFVDTPDEIFTYS